MTKFNNKYGEIKLTCPKSKSNGYLDNLCARCNDNLTCIDRNTENTLFLIAWDSNNKRYCWGTNAFMLTEKHDAERLKHCDLSRFPAGDMNGYNNRVIVIQTWQKEIICKMGCDSALSIFDNPNDSLYYKLIREL
jgi:hypothetical protein